MAIDFYSNTATFIVPNVTYQDNSPIVTEERIEVKCSIQPGSGRLQQGDDGQQQVVKYNVFVPVAQDISVLSKAKQVEVFSERRTIINFYVKPFFAHEISL